MSEPSRPPDLPQAAVALLAGAVDYAGLFPPAALDLTAAVAAYQAALDGPDAWMLGRFVLPAARLPELAAMRGSTTRRGAPWRLSAVVAPEPEAGLAAIAAFNAHAETHHAQVDVIESAPASLDAIERLADWAPAGCTVYIEVPGGADHDAWMTRIAARGLRAKIRTGGTTATAFPAAATILSFITAAVRHDVPFKATAGLHHAVRGSYRLTYAADADQAPMYGYLNVLLAAAALDSGQPAEHAEALLLGSDASTLVIDDASIGWQNITLPVSQLRRTRDTRLAGFGSCSFDEPVAELRALAAVAR